MLTTEARNENLMTFFKMFLRLLGGWLKSNLDHRHVAKNNSSGMDSKEAELHTGYVSPRWLIQLTLSIDHRNF